MIVRLKDILIQAIQDNISMLLILRIILPNYTCGSKILLDI